jgi:Fic family protein
LDDYQVIRKMWQDFRIDSEQALDLRLENFRILFAYNSGKIENNEITYHDAREIFENGKVLNFTGDPRSVMEQQNQKLCYEFLKGRITAGEPITIDLILEIHRILTSGTYDEKRYIERGERPGEFKRHDYITGIHEAGSEPGMVYSDLDDLLTEIRRYGGEDILTAAAYFHARFENIHPFADGNGRVGRTLLNYFLLIHGEPPLIIYDDDKDIYYKALERYDAEEDIAPMRGFLIVEIEKTWKATRVRGATS